MKHLLITLILTLTMTSQSWSQDTWVKTFGGSGDDWGVSIRKTLDGGFLITGSTQSNDGDFKGMNKGGEEIFIIKIDKNGDVIWKKLFGGIKDDNGQSITTTSDGHVLITGTIGSNDGDFTGMNKGRTDMFIIKLDGEGEILWKKVFGGTRDERCNSITTTSDNGILITGHTESNDGDFTGMNKGSGDIFVIKLDRDGTVLWKKNYGGSGHEDSHSITTTSDGDVLITGETYSNDGDFKGMNKGGKDIFVVKLTSYGNVVWSKTFGGKHTDIGESITTMTNGDILVTGHTSNDDGGTFKRYEDVFVVKLDNNGGVLWSRLFGGGLPEHCRSFITTTDGDTFLTGFKSSYHLNKPYEDDFEENSFGQEDVFVIKLDNDDIYREYYFPPGVQWKRLFGGSNSDFSGDIATTSDGGVLIVGSSRSNDGDFKGMNKGGFDIFVMKLDPNGSLKTSHDSTLRDR